MAQTTGIFCFNSQEYYHAKRQTPVIIEHRRILEFSKKDKKKEKKSKDANKIKVSRNNRS